MPQRLSFENRVIPRQQNIGSFIECRAHHLIPRFRVISAGDHPFFTRLILSAVSARTALLPAFDFVIPARIVHRRLEGNCHPEDQRPALSSQPAADPRPSRTIASTALCSFLVTAPSKLPAPEASALSNALQCGMTCHPIPESALQTFCGSPLADLQAETAQDAPNAQFPHPATFREAACARLAALGSPAIQSIWRVPAGNHPIRSSCASPHASLRSVFTVIADNAAFTCPRLPAERFQNPRLRQPGMQPL